MSDSALLQGGESRDFPRSKVARFVSWVGHPLVFVSASLAIVVYTQLANRVGIEVLLALILAVVLPMVFLLVRGVRSGRWSDADVSIHKERVRFYPPAILLSAGGVLALVFLHAPGFILRGACVTLALLVVAAVINRYLKISLHTIFAFYCAGTLFRIGWFTGTMALVLAILVLWSRLHLRRHGPADVMLGGMLGTIGAIAAAWLP